MQYPAPHQPIPPPAPGPTSPLSAIFARSATFVLMGLTAAWAFFLLVGEVARSNVIAVSTASDLGDEALPDPTVALAGCAGGLVIWAAGLIAAWRRPRLWAWTAAGALTVVGTTMWNALAFFG